MRRNGVLAIALFVAVVLAGGCRSDDNTAATTTPDSAVVQLYADAAAIQQLAAYLNSAYASSPADGLVAVASSTYLVWNGTYTADQCISYLRSQLGLLAGARLSETLKLETLTATPNRAIDAVGGVPDGRLYTIAVDWQVSGDPIATYEEIVDVTVVPDGTAKTIRKCA
jgi:hypothetical protein